MLEIYGSVRAELHRWNTEPLREQVKGGAVGSLDFTSLDASDFLLA
jgi:hypothetical protein